MGALFAGSECVIEKARARHDAYNSVYAGKADDSYPSRALLNKLRLLTDSVLCLKEGMTDACILYKL